MKRFFKHLHNSIFAIVTIFSVFFYFNLTEIHTPLPPAFVGSIAEPFKQSGIHVQAKAYSREESKTYLSRDLLQKGFQPIQVTIQNNTGKTYTLSKEGIDTPSASAERVTSDVIKHYIPRSIAMKVAAFFFWPMMIPGIVDTVATYYHHRTLKEDYQAKSLKEREILIPYSTTNRILFVPIGEYTDHFHLHLFDEKSNRVYLFPIDLLA